MITMDPKSIFSIRGSFFRGLLIASLFYGPSPHWANAAVSPEGMAELALTQATIDYQSGNYGECQSRIKGLLKSNPGNLAALELLALTYRQTKDDKAALRTYEALYNIGGPSKTPAYAFELASIHYKEKRFDEARKYFNVAATANFNGGTSHFYLGLMEFDAKSWKNARHHLTASLTYNDGKTMAPITRYYLASAYAQLGKSDAAIHNYHEAESEIGSAERASNSGIDSTLEGVRKNALKELKSLDKDQRFVNVTLLNQFDSNVQTNPSEVQNPTAQSSQRSLKQVVSASAGYSSSPTRDLQVTPVFNFFTNYNDHYLARDYNFMSFTPSIYALYKPYAKLSAGLKADGTFSMKNTLDVEQSRADLKYRPFSLTGNVGPVVKYELTPRVILGFETYWRPKRFYTDPADGELRRSGGGLFIKTSAEFVTPFWFLNPLAYLSYEWDRTSGKEYRMYAFGGGLSNPLPLTERLTLTASFDIVSTDFNETLPKRDDLNIATRILGSYSINEHWAAIADASYTANNSTISTSYKYNRWVGSAGASYTF